MPVIALHFPVLPLPFPPSLSFLPSPFHPLAVKRRPVPPSHSFIPVPSFRFPPPCRKAPPPSGTLPPFIPLFPSLPSPSLLHFRWLTLFCRVGCILRTIKTSKISVVKNITHRFGGWHQLIANDNPSLTTIPFVRILPFHSPGGATYALFVVDCHFIWQGAPLNYCYFTNFYTNLCFLRMFPPKAPLLFSRS